MGPLEAELDTDLRFRLTNIEGVSEVILEAFDKQDIGVLEEHPPSPTAALAIQWEILHFTRDAVMRLAREIDELRAGRTEGDDLG